MNKMSEDEKIIDNFKYWFETNTENGVSTIPDFICKKLLDLCQKEKEKNKEIEIRLQEEINEVCEMKTRLFGNSISKDKIRDMKRYREFELQQQYKDFKDDIEWKTYNKILEGE